MKILGLSHPVSMSSAACLLTDDGIIAFAEEERFNRIKHSPYLPANKSIDYCLQEGGIKLDDIDYIVFGYDTFFNIIRSNLIGKFTGLFQRVTTEKIIQKTSLRTIPISPLFTGLRYIINHYEGLFKLPFDFRDKRVHFVRHHMSHAASCYLVSPFKEACIITADGGGGQEAGILAVGRGDNIKILKTIPNNHSLGYLYSTFTDLLGFEPYDGEGKVMGLAAYGDKNAAILPFISFKNGIMKIDHLRMNRFIVSQMKNLSKDPLGKVNCNLAASLQKTIEEAYVYMADYLYKKTGIKNFCLSGGVSLNCLANTKVLNLGFVDNVYVQPASSDAGTALGAAVYFYTQIKKKRPGFVMDNAYYGPQFTNEQIEKSLLKAEVIYYKKMQNTAKIVAKLLAESNIIGWFQGRMEIGPRALGNRSILADPSNPKMKDIINNRIKGREPWRPFAPSILEEYAKDYLLDVNDSPFMILSSRVKSEKGREVISATHVDGTVRPQTVSQKTNIRFWKLINEFCKIKKIPVLLNTSFNLAGEPIVCTPEHAISTFFRTGLDYLVLGDYLISKKPIKEFI